MSKNLVNLNIDNTEYSVRPYGTCSTAPGTVAKTVDITDFTLCTGATVCVKFTNTNTASSTPTLNVNRTGAKTIKMDNPIKADEVYEFIYDGTNWVHLNDNPKSHILHKTYRQTLDYGDTETTSWWKIGTVNDAYNSPIIYVVRAYAHSSAIFTVSKGWGDTGNITVLQYCNSTNNSYAWIKGARLLNNGAVQINLHNGTLPTIIDITALSASDNIEFNTLASSLTLHDSTSTATVIHELAFVNQAMMAKKFVGDLTGNATTATNATNAENANTATTTTKIKQTVTTSNTSYPLLLAPSGQSATTNSAATYFDSGVTLNPSTNILNGAKVYESLLQWGNTNIAGGLSPIDVAMDGQWSANRLSFMPASGIQIEYSTDGGSIWTDYDATSDQKRSLVTTGLSNDIYPGKKSTRQLINTDKVRVTITAESNKTYFSLKKIYMYISQNGATDCKVLIEKAQCGSDTTFATVGTYTISGWSGWNSIPLRANFGGGDTQTENVRRIRLTFYFEKYDTNYGEAEGTYAVKFSISKINMIGETWWANSGGPLAATGHLYSWDVNQNVTFPAKVKAPTFEGHATSATYISSGGRLTAEDTIDNNNNVPGLRYYQIYENGYPFTYGNLIQVNGASGISQLAMQWHGTELAYRSAPDNSTTFSDWVTILTNKNSSVSKSGNTLTVKINGETQSLTDTTYTFGTGLETSGNSIVVKPDNKTLFAGYNAKDSESITTNYDSHPLQLGKDYGWINTGNNLSNLNNFVDYGIYNISGEHTRNNDNLPINNIGGGNTFQGRLIVYDSSLPNTGNAGNDCCITQVLILSNRVGGDGNTYIRTGVGSTKSSLTWGPWGKHQTNVEVGVINQSKMNELIDNGIYSGVISDTYETFVLVCINNYAIAAAAGVQKCISHLLYSIDLYGNVKVRTRTKNTNNANSDWSEYKELGAGNNSSNNFSLRIGSNNYHTENAALNLGSDSNSPEGVLDILTMLPANNNNIGGIKVVGTRASAITTVGTSAMSGRYYGVELDSNGKAFVNVPWTSSGTSTASSVAYAITSNAFNGSVTLNSLPKETITRISTSNTAALTEITGTITISSFAEKNSNQVTTYGLQFKVGTSGSPKLIVPSSVKWANGVEPILTGGEIIDILFTTLDGSIYTATWTKYF